MNDEKNKLILSIVMLPVAAFTAGFVLMKLWGYFIVPIFHIEQISFLQALGLALFVDFLLAKMDLSPYSDTINFEKYLVKMISHVVVSPFFILAFGYIVHLLMN